MRLFKQIYLVLLQVHPVLDTFNYRSWVITILSFFRGNLLLHDLGCTRYPGLSLKVPVNHVKFLLSVDPWNNELLWAKITRLIHRNQNHHHRPLWAPNVPRRWPGFDLTSRRWNCLGFLQFSMWSVEVLNVAKALVGHYYRCGRRDDGKLRGSKCKPKGTEAPKYFYLNEPRVLQYFQLSK